MIPSTVALAETPPRKSRLAATLDRLVPGAALPADVTLEAVPDSIDRRLPHSRRGSVWVAAGTWMMEVDPIRRRIVLIAHDVLPPDI